jgi:hypothetical protein
VKNRKVKLIKEGKIFEEKRIDEVAKLRPKEDYKLVELKDKQLWITLVKIEI